MYAVTSHVLIRSQIVPDQDIFEIIEFISDDVWDFHQWFWNDLSTVRCFIACVSSKIGQKLYVQTFRLSFNSKCSKKQLEDIMYDFFHT
jgi:hypothetical protein